MVSNLYSSTHLGWVNHIYYILQMLMKNIQDQYTLNEVWNVETWLFLGSQKLTIFQRIHSFWNRINTMLSQIWFGKYYTHTYLNFFHIRLCLSSRQHFFPIELIVHIIIGNNRSSMKTRQYVLYVVDGKKNQGCCSPCKCYQSQQVFFIRRTLMPFAC